MGHFLLEAERAGYVLPAQNRAAWLSFQQQQARRWSMDSREADLLQAYRLYTLALAGSPELGAMNRLKEVGTLSDAAAWRLAAAYFLAGQQSTAQKMVDGRSIEPAAQDRPDRTYASTLRNQALVLETLVLLDDPRAVTLAEKISAALSSDTNFSTQSTAFALVALSRFGVAQPDTPVKVGWSWLGTDEKPRTLTDVINRVPLDVSTDDSAPLVVRNASEHDVFVQVVRSGIPAVGEDQPSARHLELEVLYLTDTDEGIDPDITPHGADLTARITVKNTGPNATDLALSYVVPSGWELFGLPPGPGTDFTYRDVRDDRVLTYFDLKSGASKTFEIPVNAAYLGRFYRPPVVVEHMYDPGTYARSAGEWTKVILAGGPS